MKVLGIELVAYRSSSQENYVPDPSKEIDPNRLQKQKNMEKKINTFTKFKSLLPNNQHMYKIQVTPACMKRKAPQRSTVLHNFLVNF